ncbi:MAG: hypothetical protein CM15mP84_04480 [Cellvibrionales bacterium]|nr:MAG: hypothetical protein CM15mP84_04480 [Cellvibrionales bacterium]
MRRAQTCRKALSRQKSWSTFGREWGNFAKRRWSNTYTRRSTISEKAAGRNEASASTGVIEGRMMNNPKYITVAVVAVLFLFTGIAFGQWPDGL